MPVYLELFHGRSSIGEELGDWGSEGPILGPLTYVHITYATDLKLETVDGLEGDLRLAGEGELDLLYYDGVCYGDWSVFGPEKLQRAMAARVQQFQAAKAVPPDIGQSLRRSKADCRRRIAHSPDSLKTIRSLGRLK